MQKLKTFLTSGIAQLLHWFFARPVKALSFLFLFTFLGVLGFVLDECWSLIGVLMLLAIAYGLWTWTFTRDMKRITAFLLAGALLFNPQPLRAAPLVIGGLFVLVVGGVIGCRIVKRCDRAVRGRTNAWPEELRFAVAGEPGEYGALYTWTEEGYCIDERLLSPPVPVVFVLNITVNSASNSTVTMSANTGQEFVQSWGELQEELAGHGLSVTTGPALSSYERNQHPCDAEQVPITFDFTTRTVTLGAGGVLVIVERSADLLEWESLLKMNTYAGSRLCIADAGSGMQFYRIRTTAR